MQCMHLRCSKYLGWRSDAAASSNLAMVAQVRDKGLKWAPAASAVEDHNKDSMAFSKPNNRHEKSDANTRILLNILELTLRPSTE